ncbi:MAG: hypothetical protein IPM54_33480 [Polyangiaceae bacterium]|nr:hypothetical protein [Polyangiaceae bacterium]
MSLLRYDRYDHLELKILPPAGMGGRIVLGPKGEFYSGSATNLAKHNVNGGFLWSKSASLSGTIQSSAWDVDAHGNVLVALGFSGSVDYGNGPLSAVGPRDLGLIKLSPNGTVVWQKQYGNASFTMGTVGLSRAGLGDMAVWGDYAGSMNFGTGSLSGAKFIVKFDALGNAMWHVDILSGDGLKVTADALGAVYAGSSSFDTNFGWGTPLLNETVIAVAKYKDCPGPSGCKGNGLACKTGETCSSGSCVDGVCCDRPCDGLCEACSVSKKGQGTDGMCEAIAAGLDPDDECAFACNGLRQCAPNGAAHDMSSNERAVCTE